MAGNFKEEGTELCSGHSACTSVFSISLSTAALCLSDDGLMFDRTGSHGSGAEHRVPVMTCMVEISCTLMRSVCAEHAHSTVEAFCIMRFTNQRSSSSSSSPSPSPYQAAILCYSAAESQCRRRCWHLHPNWFSNQCLLIVFSNCHP